MDGAAASKQVSALRETIGALKSEKRMSGSEVNLIARQKELLVQKLETFETTNRTLRHLLREQHSRETDAMRLAEQREVLLKKLTDYEAENTSLLMKLQEREQEVDQLLIQVETEKENARTAGELSKTLETTRAHLQGQLRNKESENNRLNVQIRNLERTMAQQRGEMDHLQEQQKELKRRVEGDKEALKRATRAQKQRADRSEDTAGQLSAQLLEKETQLADALSAAESWRSRQSQALKDRNQMEIEITVMNKKLEEANLQNRDLVQVIAKREESIHQNQLRLEEKTRECSAMARQLEAAIDDAKHQVDQNRDRAVSKERATQAKVLDLETQLSRTKTELNQHRRSKEDADRRFQSRLQDLRDRLEQSESTNRSLQNYVHFLKASYANVFGDSALTSSTLRPPSPI
ncbi:UNVERIFIED_CONTAM: hypothetical protein FKN15_001593 [Acipenser sinensis]